MSRVVTSADIDALAKIIRQHRTDLNQTNERVARLESQVQALQGSFKALEENLIGPDPHKGLIEVPEFTGLSAAGTPVVAQSSPPAYTGLVNVAPVGGEAAFPNDPLIDLTETPNKPVEAEKPEAIKQYETALESAAFSDSTDASSYSDAGASVSVSGE